MSSLSPLPLVQATNTGSNTLLQINGSTLQVPNNANGVTVINLENGRPVGNSQDNIAIGTPLGINTFGTPSGITPPGPAATAAAQTDPMMQVLQLTVNLLSQLTGNGVAAASGFGSCQGCGSGCPGCTVGGGPTQGPGITTPLPSASTAPTASVAQLNGVNNPQLQQNLNLIATDPEGQTLLAEAQRRGVSIQVGNTGNPDTLAFFDPRNNAIVVQNPNNIKTIVHELVHAVTPENANSQTEEGVANVVGRRVESRLRGTPLENPNQTFTETLANYQHLRANNTIQQDLARLGITV